MTNTVGVENQSLSNPSSQITYLLRVRGRLHLAMLFNTAKMQHYSVYGI